MNFLASAGMGRWMESKKEVEIDDYVIYKSSGEVVCNEAGDPVRVIAFMKFHSYDGVKYDDGGWDYAERVEKASSLLLELL